MATPPTPARSLDLLLTDPERSGLFCDFDGTLSPIVARPDDARPLAGVPEVLSDLARSFARVGIMSGRPLSFLAPLFPPPIVLSGLYGLQSRVGDRIVDHPFAGAWTEVVADVAATAAASGPDGMRVEPKHLSLTLHYRGRPDIANEVESWGATQAARSGLELRPAKMSFELHPPIPVDKGTALAELAGGLTTVAYLGDDVGDLPAFDALDGFDKAGLSTVRVAVRGAEPNEAVIRRADVVLDGPDGVLDALRDLAAGAVAAGPR